MQQKRAEDDSSATGPLNSPGGRSAGAWRLRLPSARLSRLLSALLSLLLLLPLPTRWIEPATALTLPWNRNDPAAHAPAGTGGAGLQEVAPPEAVQQLQAALASRQPVVEILSPLDNTVLPPGPWTLKLRVHDWPLVDAGSLGLGPHLVIQLDQEPPRLWTETEGTLPELSPGSHRLTVYAAQPWGEARKSPGAWQQIRLHRTAPNPLALPARGSPQLVAVSPTIQAGEEPLLLDWLLLDAPLQDLRGAGSQWRLRIGVNGDDLLLDQQTPLWLRGWRQGTNALHLELLDGRGDPLNPPFNSLVLEVNSTPPGPHPRWLAGRLSDRELAVLLGNSPAAGISPHGSGEPPAPDRAALENSGAAASAAAPESGSAASGASPSGQREAAPPEAAPSSLGPAGATAKPSTAASNRSNQAVAADASATAGSARPHPESGSDSASNSGSEATNGSAESRQGRATDTPSPAQSPAGSSGPAATDTAVASESIPSAGGSGSETQYQGQNRTGDAPPELQREEHSPEPNSRPGRGDRRDAEDEPRVALTEDQAEHLPAPDVRPSRPDAILAAQPGPGEHLNDGRSGTSGEMPIATAAARIDDSTETASAISTAAALDAEPPLDPAATGSPEQSSPSDAARPAVPMAQAPDRAGAIDGPDLQDPSATPTSASAAETDNRGSDRPEAAPARGPQNAPEDTPQRRAGAARQAGPNTPLERPQRMLQR